MPVALSARRLVDRVSVSDCRRGATAPPADGWLVWGHGRLPPVVMRSVLGLGGGACDVLPPRAAPLAGPIDVIISCSPIAGCSCRLLDSAGLFATGRCSDRSTSVCHAEWNVRGRLSTIGTPARRDLLDDCDGHAKPMTTPGWLALGARPGSPAPGSGACTTDSSPGCAPPRELIRPIKVWAGTVQKVWPAPSESMRRFPRHDSVYRDRQNRHCHEASPRSYGRRRRDTSATPPSMPDAHIWPPEALVSRSAGALGLVSAVCVHRAGNPSGSWSGLDVRDHSGRSGSEADRPGDTQA
jgi:hypothetical protein